MLLDDVTVIPCIIQCRPHGDLGVRGVEKIAGLFSNLILKFKDQPPRARLCMRAVRGPGLPAQHLVAEDVLQVVVPVLACKICYYLVRWLLKAGQLP